MNSNFQKVIAILKQLNLELEDPKKQKNFQTRLVIQKIVFLSEKMGINLGNYIYSLYRNGPYSSQLTADYYEHNELVTTLETPVQLNSEETEIVEKLREIVLNHPLSNSHQADFLEAVSTAYHFKIYNNDILDDELFEKVKHEKKYINETTITIAINQLKKLLFKPKYLTDEIKKELKMWDNIGNE